MTQNRAFPNDRSGILAMLVRVVPLLGLGTIFTIVGYRLASIFQMTNSIYILFVFLVLLVSMMILDKEPGWNVVLFLGFALAAGVILLWSSAEITQPKTWILFSILVLVSLAGGLFLSKRIGLAATVLYPTTILYMIGWVLFLFFELPGLFKMIWIVLGLVLFTLIIIAILSRGENQSQEDNAAVPLAIELYVLLFNLFWLSSML
ncbi:MAG: hypothetical protein MUO54_10975 [Anaerolineales bacterium]|nr:hypothetical protein [Anaerolineales bacterium]